MTEIHRPARPGRLRLAAALGLALVAAGCGGGFGAPADADDGLKALTTALDAWKGGEKPASLAQREPAIHVADGDWDAGFQLQGYTPGEGRHVGADLNYKVTLELKSPKGKVTKKNAVYAVSTQPKLLVLRQDD